MSRRGHFALTDRQLDIDMSPDTFASLRFASCRFVSFRFVLFRFTPSHETFVGYKPWDATIYHRPAPAWFPRLESDEILMVAGLENAVKQDLTKIRDHSYPPYIGGRGPEEEVGLSRDTLAILVILAVLVLLAVLDMLVIPVMPVILVVLIVLVVRVVFGYAG